MLFFVIRGRTAYSNFLLAENERGGKEAHRKSADAIEDFGVALGDDGGGGAAAHGNYIFEEFVVISNLDGGPLGLRSVEDCIA